MFSESEVVADCHSEEFVVADVLDTSTANLEVGIPGEVSFCRGSYHGSCFVFIY